jgi:hypothetical protein
MRLAGLWPITVHDGFLIFFLSDQSSLKGSSEHPAKKKKKKKISTEPSQSFARKRAAAQHPP